MTEFLGLDRGIECRQGSADCRFSAGSVALDGVQFATGINDLATAGGDTTYELFPCLGHRSLPIESSLIDRLDVVDS